MIYSISIRSFWKVKLAQHVSFGIMVFFKSICTAFKCTSCLSVQCTTLYGAYKHFKSLFKAVNILTATNCPLLPTNWNTKCTCLFTAIYCSVSKLHDVHCYQGALSSSFNLSRCTFIKVHFHQGTIPWRCTPIKVHSYQCTLRTWKLPIPLKTSRESPPAPWRRHLNHFTTSCISNWTILLHNIFFWTQTNVQCHKVL